MGWLARKRVDDRDMIVMRHSHYAGDDRYAYERISTVVALAIGDTRPGVWLTRTNSVTERREKWLGHTQDLRIGEAWLDANFRVQSHDESSLNRILTPAVRQFIAAGPYKESWTVGYGYIVCVFGANTSPEGVDTMIGRVMVMRELMEQNARS